MPSLCHSKWRRLEESSSPAPDESVLIVQLVGVNNVREADDIHRGRRQDDGGVVVREKEAPRPQHPRHVGECERLLEHIMVDEDVRRDDEVEPFVGRQRLRPLQHDIQIARDDRHELAV